MGLVLFLMLGALGWFTWAWLRNDWDTAMRSVPGRAARSAVTAGHTAWGWQGERERRKRGLSLDHHRGRRLTEVIDIEHDRRYAPKRVVVCSADKAVAFNRVAESMRPGAWQLVAQRPQSCDVAKGRQHHPFDLRKKRGARR